MRKRLREWVLWMTIFALSAGVWAGCAGKDTDPNTESREKKTVSAEEHKIEHEVEYETEPDTEYETERDMEPELKTVDQPHFVSHSLRKLILVEDGEEIFRICREPADYKMGFDYWEILNPYDESATVNTEAMYGLFETIATLDFTAQVTVEEDVDTGIKDSATSITVEFVNTTDQDEADARESADSMAVILIGSEDGEGHVYAAVEGYEDVVYKLPASVVSGIYQINPFDYILKIPVLVKLDTVQRVDITAGKSTYVMEKDGETYKLGKTEVGKETFTALYQALMNVTLESEIREAEKAEEKKEVLRIIFRRTTREAPETEMVFYIYDESRDSVEVNGKEQFLVSEEAVEALLAQIEEVYQNIK